MQRRLAGLFVGRDLGDGAWVLTTGATSGPEIYLRGMEPGAAQVLTGESIDTVTVEWHAEGVTLALRRGGGVGYLRARSAIVHEPKSRLFDHLPLASFDIAARRFWRRVFRLTRLPGGRYLLGFMARRNRGAR
jgi:hypothetical protein